jgi:dihydroorotate dehydrogenase
LRYSFVDNGWVNKIGLRNKGIDHMFKNYNYQSVYSLAILDPSDISKMVEKIPASANIEINISCPHAEKSMVYQGLKPFQNTQRKWCIIKLSPLVTMDTINDLYQQGFRQFHISNTLPTSRGGVQSIYDAELYKTAGANHIGISTLLFHPLKTISFYNDWKKYSKYI